MLKYRIAVDGNVCGVENVIPVTPFVVVTVPERVTGFELRPRNELTIANRATMLAVAKLDCAVMS